MNLHSIIPAVVLVNDHQRDPNLLRSTYLRTYPHLLRLASANGPIDEVRFCQVAACAYGWMGRALRVDFAHLANAVTALSLARDATPENFREIPIDDLRRCLHSGVGASKVLHFTNPDIFPIWDAKVEEFRLHCENPGHPHMPNPSHPHMQNMANYLCYATAIHAIKAENGFTNFYQNFTASFAARLGRINVPNYEFSEVRAIEVAAFELAQV